MGRFPKKLLTFLRICAVSIFGWAILVPLSRLFPKKRGSVLFIEQAPGLFADNCKYLFLHHARTREGGVFLTRDAQTADLLRNVSLPVIRGRSLRAWGALLRAETVVVDGFSLRTGIRFFIAYGSRKIQLWHGFPLKKINLQRYPSPHSLPARTALAFWTFAGRFPLYDLLLSTSSFCTERALAGAFRARSVTDAGYPRNDVLFRSPTAEDLLGTDAAAMATLGRLKEQGKYLILYAPTFRDSGGDAVCDGALDLEKLDDFARRAGAVVVFKAHFNEDVRPDAARYRHLLVYGTGADVYPALPLFDLLVTDYSSIFFDYLLTRKPVVFFPYDYEKYIVRDRPLIFNYRDMTPGPVCFTQHELEEAIRTIMSGDDAFASRREEMLAKAFTFPDGNSSERILKLLETGWES
ncbi:MAG TPA: CDP-glycerol glycerophosphotransferase family protein [bacterium]|nr:CDP-glycerol glycerophosphotransferase family protein [bacterium]HPJ71130.1 CDP-glycerol glycerophosphotransferase family protein [bacterium]HPQ65414.1 CDP-glycerol glycerophosphotransferase family protein [bacterium]